MKLILISRDMEIQDGNDLLHMAAGKQFVTHNAKLSVAVFKRMKETTTKGIKKMVLKTYYTLAREATPRDKHLPLYECKDTMTINQFKQIYKDAGGKS